MDAVPGFRGGFGHFTAKRVGCVLVESSGWWLIFTVKRCETEKKIKNIYIYNMYSTCSVFHVFNDSSIKSFGHNLGVFRSDRLVKGN